MATKIDLDLIELNNWLEQFINFKRPLDSRERNLATMRILAEKFGYPERKIPCFHVTGSKGKGTIAADTAAILRGMGYKTGVFGSPHVLHFTERVWDGERAFSQEVYDIAYERLRNGVEELVKARKVDEKDLTWHELATMYAMLCFELAGCEYTVYEISAAGGRLDPTNIIQPEVCMFGPIELEHTKILGNTLSEIATEKAGIIKEMTPVISVAQTLEVETVLKRAAKERQAEIAFMEGGKDYLTEDAGIAKYAVRKVLPEMDEKEANEAISKVRLPGRFERIGDILIDVAHTPNSMRAVVERMKREAVRGNLLFGCAIDKNVEEMAKILYESDLFEDVYLTRPGDFKKSDLSKMVKAFKKAGYRVEADEDFRMMIRRAAKESKKAGKTLIVLGSFYLAGEVKQELNLS